MDPLDTIVPIVPMDWWDKLWVLVPWLIGQSFIFFVIWSSVFLGFLAIVVPLMGLGDYAVARLEARGCTKDKATKITAACMLPGILLSTFTVVRLMS